MYYFKSIPDEFDICSSGFKEKCLTCDCLLFSFITLLPVAFITAVSTQYDRSIYRTEELISPIDIFYKSQPLLTFDLVILVSMLLVWALSFFLKTQEVPQIHYSNTAYFTLHVMVDIKFCKLSTEHTLSGPYHSNCSSHSGIHCA